MSDARERFEKILRNSGHSLTKARLAVFQELQDHESVTMGQLGKELVGSSDRASIYRTVDLFVDLAVAKRVNVGWKYKIELSEEFADHHHHLTCNQCGKVVAINEDALEQFIHQLSQRHGFRPSAHQVEIVGLCGDCAN